MLYEFVIEPFNIEDIFPKELGVFLIPLFKKYNCFLCGGSLISHTLNTSIVDYDIYFNSIESFHSIKEIFEERVSKNSNTIKFWDTTNAITYHIYHKGTDAPIRWTIQLIKRSELIKRDIKEILCKFDFTCCMAGISFKTNELTYLKEWKDILQKKELNYNVLSYLPSTINVLARIAKYINKGFTISYHNLFFCYLNLLYYSSIPQDPESLKKIDAKLCLLKQCLNLSDYSRVDFFNKLSNGQLKIEY